MILLDEPNISSIFNESFRELETKGFSLIRINHINTLKDAEMERRLLSTLVCLGVKFAKTVAYKILEGTESRLSIEKHTECIYVQENIPKYFSIGCLRPSEVGGNTRIFDSRRAAENISNIDVEILSSIIEYRSNSYPGSRGVHQLCVDGVVRFRDRCSSNRILSRPSKYSDDEFYSIVSKCINDSMIESVEWRSGDILIVNNTTTLHDRTPYRGLRKMIRVRYDDPLNVYVRY